MAKTKETTFPKKGGGTVTYPTISRMPKGWKEVKGATTAPNGYTWVSNGKSLFGGERQHALIKTSAMANSNG